MNESPRAKAAGDNDVQLKGGARGWEGEAREGGGSATSSFGGDSVRPTAIRSGQRLEFRRDQMRGAMHTAQRAAAIVASVRRRRIEPSSRKFTHNSKASPNVASRSAAISETDEGARATRRRAAPAPMRG